MVVSDGVLHQGTLTTASGSHEAQLRLCSFSVVLSDLLLTHVDKSNCLFDGMDVVRYREFLAELQFLDSNEQVT